MTASPPRPRFALHSRGWAMGAPDCERVIERPEGRRKLKLGGRPTLGGLAPDELRAAWESPSQSYPSVHVRASEMSSVGKCARCRDKGHGRPPSRADKEPGAGRRSQVFLPSGLTLPVAWLDTYGRRRHVGPWSQEFSPAGHPASGDPDRHSSRMRLRHQNSWLRPGRGAALALCPPLADSGSVSSSRP